MSTDNNLITSITPTFFLKKVNFDTIITNYNNNKYSTLSALSHKPNTDSYIGTNIKLNDKTIGFQCVFNNNLIRIHGKEKSYNVCMNCNQSITGYCSLGIPYKITSMEIKNESYNYIYDIEIDGETCSIECTFSYLKRLGHKKMNLSSRYMDSEELLRIMQYLLFGEMKLKEANFLSLIPHGNESLNEWRKKLHMYTEYKELENIIVIEPKERSEKVELKKPIIKLNIQ
jgi:hypothetical protein